MPHAHSDHIAPHQEVIVSERTSHLMRARLPGSRIEHPLSFGERRSIRNVDVMLLPAGHIFGSAQCLVFAGEEALLYTGDFKLRPGKSAEQTEWRHADTLVMETTFGVPRYRFPPTKEVINGIVAFCGETIDAGEVPVLLGYSLGKAQEILCALDGAGLTPMVACDRGTSAAPNIPCSRRKATISVREFAMPHSAEAIVKPVTHTRKRRLRPKCEASHPTGAVKIAAATTYEVSTQVI